jgi:hypothetical protein
MKTIITVLPIYDRIIKQCYERSARASGDAGIRAPVVCPRHHLPPWQYNAEAVAIGAVTKIELINTDGVATDITTYFPLLSDDVTVDLDTYYKYDGDTLKYLLPTGLYYLRITHANAYIYYSDWILVDCVYENQITSMANFDNEVFSTTGTAITVQNTAGNGHVYSLPQFDVIKDIPLTVIFYLTYTSGQYPIIDIVSGVSIITNSVNATAGLNIITLTPTGNYNNATIQVHNTLNASFSTTDIYLICGYSDKYLKFAFEHSCDLGEITYDDGFSQVLYLETETMEPTFPYTEKGQENGYGQFVPTFQRQEKTYLIRTMLLPQFIVDVLHRLKLHDTIVLTDLVGDTNTVTDIEVEHEWQFEDKYYALATIIVGLGEEIIVTGCCTAINDCL